MVSTKPATRFDIYKFVLTLPGILVIYSVMFTAYFLIRLEKGNEPIALKLGGLTFRWYGILITLGVVIALYLTQYLAERRGENPDRAWALLPILLVTGLAGARTWYVINTWGKYKDYIFSIGDPNTAGAFEIWRGGIAIQGAVFGGAIGILIYKYFTKISFLRWADFIAPGLIIAQALGRWGNFFNNEAYGSQTDVPWGVYIPCEYRTRGTTPGTADTSCPGIPADATFHPTFFYESVWNYAVFLTLFFMIMYPKKVQRAIKIRLRDGDILLAYLVLYSIGRFMIEALRTDSLFIIGNPVDGGIRSAQLLSIISIFIGVIFLFVRHRTATPDNEALSMRVAPRSAMATTTPAGNGEVTDDGFEAVEDSSSEDDLEVDDASSDFTESSGSSDFGSDSSSSDSSSSDSGSSSSDSSSSSD